MNRERLSRDLMGALRIYEKRNMNGFGRTGDQIIKWDRGPRLMIQLTVVSVKNHLLNVNAIKRNRQAWYYQTKRIPRERKISTLPVWFWPIVVYLFFYY